MEKKVLIIHNGEFNREYIEKLSQKDHVTVVCNDEEMQNGIDNPEEYSAILMCADKFLSKEILQKFSNLEIISFGGTGYADFIDMNYCNTKNIKVTNTPGANSPAVAEFAIGLMLMLTRKMVFDQQQLKQNREIGLLVSGVREVSSMVIGIAGFGNIGSKIAKIIKNGFGAKVIYTSRTNKNNEFEFVSKEELLKQSDVLFLAMDKNDSNIDYISKKELEVLKNESIIINPSRPHLVNGKDICEALINGDISGYAMDGNYTENPQSAEDKINNGLFDLGDDLFINTAHIASKTVNAWDNMDRMAIDNVINFFDDKKDEYYLVN